MRLGKDGRAEFVSRLLQRNFLRVEGVEGDNLTYRVWSRNAFDPESPHVTIEFEEALLEKAPTERFAQNALQALQLAKRALLSVEGGKEGMSLRVAGIGVDLQFSGA